MNAEFNSILSNGEDLAWPATKAKDLDGQQLIFDADADTHFTADTDDRLDLALAGVDLFRWDGTITTPINGLDFIASATGNAVQIKAVGSDTDIDINIVPKGSGVFKSGGTNVLADPMTTRGDVIYRNSSNVTARLAVGAANKALVSDGTDPSWGTINNAFWSGADLSVANGGTSRSSATAYAVLCGGTTSTAAHQSIAGVGTSGHLLTSNGAGALPTFQAGAARVDLQEFTGNGTYTKPAGAVGVMVLAWGAGASGGKHSAGAGGGSGGGGYNYRIFDAADVGATETVAIGAGGAAKSSNGNGNAGGNTTFGSLLTAYGGGGGGSDTTSANVSGGGGGGALGAGSAGGGGGVGGAGGGPAGGGPASGASDASVDGWGGAGGAGDTGNAGGDAGYGGAGGGAGASGNGGASLYGGGGGGASTAGSGGTSQYGGNGGGGGATGTAGTAPGGSGGGSTSGNSGAGADGRIEVYTWS